MAKAAEDIRAVTGRAHERAVEPFHRPAIADVLTQAVPTRDLSAEVVSVKECPGVDHCLVVDTSDAREMSVEADSGEASVIPGPVDLPGHLFLRAFVGPATTCGNRRRGGHDREGEQRSGKEDYALSGSHSSSHPFV